MDTVTEDTAEGLDVCPNCNKKFQLRNLINHLKNVHKYDSTQILKFRSERREGKEKGEVKEASESDCIFRCPYCECSYTAASSVRRHMGTDHNCEKGESYIIETGNVTSIVGNGQFTCDTCHIQFSKLEFLNEHQESKHDGQYPEYVRSMVFPQKSEFDEWLNNIQKVSGTTYVIRQSYKITGGVKCVLYKCHRDGDHRSEARVRVPATSKKIGQKCTSFAKVVLEYDNGIVSVKCSTKHNHPINYATLRLTESDVKFLRMEIDAKKSNDQILSELMEKYSENDKLHYITADDLRNVRDKYGDTVGRYDVDDYTSICLAADRNPNIRLFHQSIDSTGDGFFLVYINDLQLEWLKKYGSRGIQIDDSFNVVRYNLRFTSVMVIDNFDRFRPAVFMISYRLRAEEISQLFNVIKTLVPDFKPKYFSSDEASELYNGYIEAYPENEEYTKKIMCHYHIIETWKRYAKSVFENNDVGSQALRFLINALKTDERVIMEKSILKFLSFCALSEDGRKFSKYFSDRYEKKIEDWATCYREHAPFNTSTGAESWFNALKSYWLGRRRSMRLDRFLVLLDEAVATIEHRRKIEMLKGLSKSHTRAAKTNKYHLNMINETIEFEPRLESNGDDKFTIYWKDDTQYTLKYHSGNCFCDTEENIHCRMCHVCAYEFTCSCRNGKPGVACVHTHYFKENYKDQINSTTEALDNENYVGNLERNVFENEYDMEYSEVYESESNIDSTDDVHGFFTFNNERSEGNSDSISATQNRRLKLRNFQENLDLLNACAESLSKSRSAGDDKEFDRMCHEISEMTSRIKIDLADHLPKLSSNRQVAINPSIKDETMRQKIGFPARKFMASRWKPNRFICMRKIIV